MTGPEIKRALKEICPVRVTKDRSRPFLWLVTYRTTATKQQKINAVFALRDMGAEFWGPMGPTNLAINLADIGIAGCAVRVRVK